LLATDIHPAMARRARDVSYRRSSLNELSDAWRERAFERRDELYVLRPQVRHLVTVRGHDLRADPPTGTFDVVLCLNVAFTYFAPQCQRGLAGEARQRARPRRRAGHQHPRGAPGAGA